MAHDPLCPSVTACNCRHDECCFCDSEVWCMCRLIAKVRADERSQAGARVAGLVHWEDGWPENVVVNRASAIYAAESVEDE